MCKEVRRFISKGAKATGIVCKAEDKSYLNLACSGDTADKAKFKEML